jgi:hypothetical protein
MIKEAIFYPQEYLEDAPVTYSNLMTVITCP